MAPKTGAECHVDRFPSVQSRAQHPVPFLPIPQVSTLVRLVEVRPIFHHSFWPGLATCRPLYLGPWQFLDWKRKERANPEIALGLSPGPQTDRRSQRGTSLCGTQVLPSRPRYTGMDSSHEWAERGRIRTLLTMVAAEE